MLLLCVPYTTLYRICKGMCIFTEKFLTYRLFYVHSPHRNECRSGGSFLCSCHYLLGVYSVWSEENMRLIFSDDKLVGLESSAHPHHFRSSYWTTRGCLVSGGVIGGRRVPSKRRLFAGSGKTAKESSIANKLANPEQ
ncbi:hypothetical protein CIHG_05178 [Coccidioides immitis H538.4]|uniref:Uncharacterized protein n=1 Tax=Coccidioides immitis H538.4 TaxID=396776 RepID=A0A0J8RQL9_COCIT|nr:hypothetical protein CIHG_05178 [Coccidioides immitis H538.4]